MFIEISDYTDFLVKHRITPNQFYVCWLIYSKNLTDAGRFIRVNGTFDIEDIDNLINRGYILSSVGTNHDGRYDFINLIITPKFYEDIEVSDDLALDDLIEAYPKFVNVNGQLFSSVSMTMQEEKDLRLKYNSQILRNKKLHEEVLIALNLWKSKGNEYAPMKIEKFIVSKHWLIMNEGLKQQKDHGFNI